MSFFSLLKSEKEWKKFGLSLIPSNRYFVPRPVQIDLLPVVFVGTNPARSTNLLTLLTVLTADEERRLGEFALLGIPIVLQISCCLRSQASCLSLDSRCDSTLMEGPKMDSDDESISKGTYM